MLPRIEVSLCMSLVPHVNAFVKGKVKTCRALNLGGRAALHLKGLLFHKISVGDESEPENMGNSIDKMPLWQRLYGNRCRFWNWTEERRSHARFPFFPGPSSANDSETKVICGMV